MKCKGILALLLVVVASLVCVVSGVASPPTNLLVEYLKTPVEIGIDTPRPRFAFSPQVTDPAQGDRGLVQYAYQIVLTDDNKEVPIVYWDSGRVLSNQTSQIVYGSSGTPRPLESSSTYHWRVRWWPNAQAPGSAFSESATFNTGFLKGKSEWTGTWIGGALNQYRKEFTTTKTVVKARAYILGLGYYELYINGIRVSDHVLDPAWTHYSIRSEYVSYDVLQLLHTAPNAANAIGVWLGHGWYGQGWNGPYSLLFQLELFYSDGTHSSVVSDTTWKSSQGPIISDSIYNGETYDARREQEGWNHPHFNDSTWRAASPISPPSSSVNVVAQMLPPVKRMVTGIHPKTVNQPKSGYYVYDFEQNFSGWVKITIPGSISKTAGVVITLSFAEILQFDKSGMIYTANLRTAKATDTYITKGDANGEVYEPHFTYHGFQFMQLTYSGAASNFPPLALTDVEGIHVYSSVPTIGSLSFDNPIMNQLARNIWWGQSSNLMSVPTDCDQRDERLGWMADGQLSTEEAMHNFDMPAFYTNWVRLMGDEVGSDGSMTDTVPFVRYGSRPADPAWGAAYPLCTYWLWKYYNDVEIVKEQWDGLMHYVQFLVSKIDAGGIGRLYGYYGDWVPPPPAGKASISFTSGWYAILNIVNMAELAQKAVQNATQAQYLNQLAQKYIAQFNSAWFRSNSYDFGLQCDLSLPLYMGPGVMVPQNLYQAVANNLVNNVQHSTGGKISTGILGTKYVMLALSMIGRTDVAIGMTTNTGYPGWAWEFANQTYEAAATTVWELWDAPLEGPGMNSRNHIMYGSWSDWAFKWLAGIQQMEGSSGYRNVVINPYNLGGAGLNSASGKVDGWPGLGELSSSWKVSGATSELKVNLPVGVQGELRLSTRQAVQSVVVREGQHVIWQGGRFVSGASGITGGVANGNNQIVFTVGSGHYVFSQ